MKECKYCKMIQVDDGDETPPLFMGEERKEGHDYPEEMSAGISVCGDMAFLCIGHDVKWVERVPFSVCGFKGSTELETGYDDEDLFQIKYCPWCGREL